jgi:hypothetical protein
VPIQGLDETFMVMGQDRQKRLVLLAAILLGMFVVSAIVVQSSLVAASPSDQSPAAYLPLMVQPRACPQASTNQYTTGAAYQFDLDNPVRYAWNHADKNLSLRGYTANTDSGLQRELVDYDSDDSNQPPQFATLFKPSRVPELIGFYQVGEWIWAPSPDPGYRSAPIVGPKVTALGLRAASGETIYVHSSGYDIGGGMEVLLIYADENSVTLRYTREDSSGPAGYSVFIVNICTDPNLLALYRQTDDPNGPRYTYVPPGSRPYSYDLPNLPAGKALGMVKDGQIVIAISDTGRFWDPRSCNEWWQIRPGYTGSCPDSH